MLKAIEKKLKSEELPVFYGLVPETEEIEVWNYIVFNRGNMEKAGNVNFKQYYEVHMIYEEYVPEKAVMDMIIKIEKIPGMRVADAPITHQYVLKGNTDMVVEMATITFVRTVKGCDRE